MARGKYEVGDEVVIKGTVTGVWPDGAVTVQLAGVAQKVTFLAESEALVPGDRAPGPKPSGKPKRLV